MLLRHCQPGAGFLRRRVRRERPARRAARGRLGWKGCGEGSSPARTTATGRLSTPPSYEGAVAEHPVSALLAERSTLDRRLPYREISFLEPLDGGLVSERGPPGAGSDGRTAGRGPRLHGRPRRAASPLRLLTRARSPSTPCRPSSPNAPRSIGYCRTERSASSSLWTEGSSRREQEPWKRNSRRCRSPLKTRGDAAPLPTTDAEGDGANAPVVGRAERPRPEGVMGRARGNPLSPSSGHARTMPSRAITVHPAADARRPGGAASRPAPAAPSYRPPTALLPRLPPTPPAPTPRESPRSTSDAQDTGWRSPAAGPAAPRPDPPRPGSAA